ncbi:hypothetical protein, partial [Staphylococcus felis]|uniref:hypothetical protein n=1 Tax=Staphylococcus felis TaxID=46127 RepID=UPI000E394DA2
VKLRFVVRVLDVNKNNSKVNTKKKNKFIILTSKKVKPRLIIKEIRAENKFIIVKVIKYIIYIYIFSCSNISLFNLPKNFINIPLQREEIKTTTSVKRQKMTNQIFDEAISNKASLSLL